jgi:hypothetical protein
MNAVMELPLAAASGILGRARNRIRNEFAADAEDWSSLVTALRRFQDTELLDNPTEANLHHHQQTLELLISFGELLLAGTKSPVFSDRPTHEMVMATLQILRDDLALWHGRKNPLGKNAAILAACFPG